MIQLSKNYSSPEREEEFITIKIVSVGGAGLSVLDRIVLDGLEGAEVLAVNTDVQSLASSVAAHKVQLGRTVTRGLGTGGDPELGYQAAEESAEETREALAGARMIFICAGLGGGTGSGAAPYIAQLAREAGSLVVAFATLPFGFEGKRRRAQAQEALGRLNEIANAVICFENDQMGDIVAPKAGIHQAFATADITISQSVRSIVNLIQRPGLIRIGFDDLLAALRSRNGRCLFGFGESDSDNRAHDALTQALKNPLMDRGRMLGDATRELVQVAGGPAWPQPSMRHKPEPRLSTPQTDPVPMKEGEPSTEKNVQAKQEVLQFEPVTRGRFEKSEPIIVEGEDLDVPTYLRKKIKVK